MRMFWASDGSQVNTRKYSTMLYGHEFRVLTTMTEVMVTLTSCRYREPLLIVVDERFGQNSDRTDPLNQMSGQKLIAALSRFEEFTRFILLGNPPLVSLDRLRTNLDQENIRKDRQIRVVVSHHPEDKKGFDSLLQKAMAGNPGAIGDLSSYVLVGQSNRVVNREEKLISIVDLNPAVALSSA